MTPGAQARRCFEIILAALAEAGARAEDVVRTRMFLTSAADADAVSAVHGELFGDITARGDNGGDCRAAGPALEGGDRSRGAHPTAPRDVERR